MQHCTLSVIIPVYNTAQYLRKCIDSVLQQRVPDMEILLIDDGSTDDSSMICKEYADNNPQIKYYYKNNGGLSSARNYGLELSTGDYITFVDSDDYLDKDVYLASLSEIGNCDAVVFGTKMIDESNHITSIDRYETEEISIERILSKLVFQLKSSVWNKIFKREFIKHNRFPTNRIHGEDLVFILNCLTSKSTFKTVNTIGYNYIKHSGTITTSGLNASSFDEVWCKDTAANILTTKFHINDWPCQQWRFRARLNICRKILMSNSKEINPKYIQYMHELEQIYHEANSLSFRIKFEYILIKHFPILYKLIIRIK